MPLVKGFIEGWTAMPEYAEGNPLFVLFARPLKCQVFNWNWKLLLKGIYKKFIIPSFNYG
jgi:hypothetical protein